ncbi:tape measure protein [Pseudomonas sp. PA27(2017)]|uniref:tape measure protein n=1 Tax=Pseudomonas sp. PA27(2017) TaxID=1932112 RepID=UPI0009648466|nr:tape measure protein [Pseudomonas sp. PA27(2017)]OLU23875.1 hypothetical protein BVH06_22125 [Pseudomonas sp. PA27(2017)]
MADVELRLTADTDGAEKGISGFRKEYQELVKVIQKPLSQIEALQKTTESAKKATAEFFAAKRRVDELKTAIAAAGQPVKELDRDLARAERTLNSATRAFELQKNRVREQRAELKAAGVDYRNLAAEQQRLQGALAGAIGKGQGDAAISRAMDTFGVTKLRELRAQLVTLRSDYARLTQAGQMSAQERIAAEIQYQASLRRTQQQIAALGSEQGSEGGSGIAAITARIAAVAAAAYTVQRVASFYFNAADAVGELEDRMRNALPTQEAYERSQARLEDASRRLRVPIEQVSELFLGTLKPLNDMGFSTAQVTDVVAALNAGLVANSIKGQRAASVIDAINKGMQTGVIRGDAFNAVLLNSSALTDALTKSLGVSRAELIRMANAGELTTEKFVNAMSEQSAALLGMADAMRVTGGDAAGTFSQSIDKLIGSIDKITGASAAATSGLDKISDSISDLVDGKGQKAVDLLNSLAITAGKQLGTLIPGFGAGANLADAYQQYSAQAADAIEDVTQAEELGRTEAERIEEQRLASMRAYASQFTTVQEVLTNAFKTAVNDQVAAQTRANSRLRKAQDEQLATQKRYKDAYEKLRVGATGPASYGNATDLKVAANRALVAGDFQRAKKYAQESLDMLIELADAGESTWGFAGLIKGLEAIENQADSALVKNAEALRQKEIDKVRDLKKELEELKNFKLSPTVDDAALAEATAKMQRWAQMIGKSFVIDPRSGSVSTPGAASTPSTPPAATPSAPPKVSGTVAADVQPTGIKQAAGSETSLPPVKAPVAPSTIRQDGPNSWTNLPPVEADILPKGIRKVAENSFTNLPVVEVDVLPKGIRKDGANSFTNLPAVEAEVVVKKVSVPEDGPPVVPALLRPIAVAPDVPPVAVESKLSEESTNGVLQQFSALIEQLKGLGNVPINLSVGPSMVPSGPLPGYATGGIIRGPGTGTSDSIVARLSNGEGVLNARAVRHFGPDFVHQLNRLQMPAFAEGGVFRAPPISAPSIPQPSQALLDRAAGPDYPDLGSVNFNLPGGESVTAYMPSNEARRLQRLAMKFGKSD